MAYAMPMSLIVCLIITGPPKHSVGARLVTVVGVCRRLSSVTLRRACRRQRAYRWLNLRRPGDDVMPPPR